MPKISKSERLIYVIIFLWILFGILGIKFQSNLAQVAGYYASLTLFVATYLWGEFKRTSKSTPVFQKGRNSSREIVIYITVILWTVLGLFGVFSHVDINQLTVYFAALTPFISSYIIYKTSKGKDLPIFDGKSQDIVDSAITTADITKTVKPKKKEETKSEEIIENDVITPIIDESDIEDEVF